MPPHARIALFVLACVALTSVGALLASQPGLRPLFGLVIPIFAMLTAGGMAGLQLPAAIAGDEQFMEQYEREAAQRGGSRPQPSPVESDLAGLSPGQRRREKMLRRERTNRAARARELVIGVALTFAYAIAIALVLFLFESLLTAAGVYWGLPGFMLLGPLMFLVVAVPFLVTTVVYRRIVETYLV